VGREKESCPCSKLSTIPRKHSDMYIYFGDE